MFKLTKILYFPLLIILTLAELMILYYLKDNKGVYSLNMGITFSEFFRRYGGSQFILVAYVQKLVIAFLFTYQAILSIAFIRSIGGNYSKNIINKLEINKKSIFYNFLGFIYLVIVFVAVKNPEEIVNNPTSFYALIFQLNPIFWGFFVYGICTMVLPLLDFFTIVKRELFFLIIVIFIAVVFQISSIRNFLVSFWSDLLLSYTIKLSTNISNFIGLPVNTFQPTSDGYPVFGTNIFQVEIWPGCSGYEGMTLAIFILSFYCYLYRHLFRFPNALLIIPFSGLLMFLLNSVRLVALLAIGHYWSPEVAINGFHTVAGWLNLILVLIISISILDHGPLFLRNDTNKNKSFTLEKTQALLLPIAALLATGLIAKAFTASFSWLYPIPVIITFCILYRFRSQYLPFINSSISFSSILAGILVFCLWVFLIPYNFEASHAFEVSLTSVPLLISIVWLLLRFIGAVFIVPVVEELAFRGFLQPYIDKSMLGTNLKAYRRIFSLVLTSITFGFLHSEFLAATLAGLIYGFVYLSRNKVMDSIVSHATTNFLLAIYILLFGYWSYW